MPLYTVPIQGPNNSGAGTITVNASDPAAAVVNASQGGNTPTGGATQAGGGSPSAPSSPSGGGGGGGGTGFNAAAAQAANQQALNAAQAAYWQALIAGQSDRLAFDKATEAFNESMKQAELTGVIPAGMTGAGGQTQAAIAQQITLALNTAATTGSYVAPGTTGPGVKTQAAIAQEAKIALDNAIATGVFNGQPTQAAIAQANKLALDNAIATGVFDGQATQAAIKQAADITAQQAATSQGQQQINNKAVQDYLTLISGLKGPADYGSYLRTIGSTPGGLQDLVSSAAGNYRPATGAVTGTATTPQTLESLMTAGSTGVSGGTPANTQAGVVSGATAAGADMMTTQDMVTMPNGQTVPRATALAQGWTPPARTATPAIAAPTTAMPAVTNPQTGLPVADAGTTYASYMEQANKLPNPNQISPQAWNAYTTGQKQMIVGMYGQRGFDQQDVLDLYKQSLPKYALPSGTTGTVKI